MLEMSLIFHPGVVFALPDHYDWLVALRVRTAIFKSYP